jgi:steroid 5-alpha reductase family enzyme
MKDSIRNSRPAGVLISVCAYVAALFVAIAAFRIANTGHLLVSLAVADLAATVFIFLVSAAVNNSSIYDPYWSVKPAVIAGFYFVAVSPVVGLREMLVLGLVFLYSIRLTSNFYRDWPGLVKEDFRYVNFRKKFPKGYWGISFLAVHLFPTIMVFLGCLPMFGIFSENTAPLSLWDALGALVLFGAVAYAFIADEQLRRFKKDPSNHGRTIETGLWKYSRHPNYLGEICTWWGLFFFAVASGCGWWWTGIGAVAITVMFIFASIPLMEVRMLATRTDYAEYRNRVPSLLPKIKRS